MVGHVAGGVLAFARQGAEGDDLERVHWESRPVLGSVKGVAHSASGEGIGTGS